MIGRIVNEKVTNFNKGLEKGHFEFGGSTIIYLFGNSININKVLGSGMISKKIEITCSNFSKRAIEKIEQAGGKCIISSD